MRIVRFLFFFFLALVGVVYLLVWWQLEKEESDFIPLPAQNHSPIYLEKGNAYIFHTFSVNERIDSLEKYRVLVEVGLEAKKIRVSNVTSMQGSGLEYSARHEYEINNVVYKAIGVFTIEESGGYYFDTVKLPREELVISYHDERFAPTFYRFSLLGYASFVLALLFGFVWGIIAIAQRVKG